MFCYCDINYKGSRDVIFPFILFLNARSACVCPHFKAKQHVILMELGSLWIYFCPQRDVLEKREREVSCTVTVYLLDPVITSFVYTYIYICLYMTAGLRVG